MFDVGPHAQRRAELARLARGELPAEAAAEYAGEDPASAAAREPRDLDEWRQAAASAQRGGGPVDFSVGDVAELAGVAKHGKQPSPADVIRAEVIKYASRRVHAALALVLAFIAHGLAPEPADWQVGSCGTRTKTRACAQTSRRTARLPCSQQSASCTSAGSRGASARPPRQTSYRASRTRASTPGTSSRCSATCSRGARSTPSARSS